MEPQGLGRWEQALMLAAKDPALPPRLCLPALPLVLEEPLLTFYPLAPPAHMAFTTIAGLRLRARTALVVREVGGPLTTTGTLGDRNGGGWG